MIETILAASLRGYGLELVSLHRFTNPARFEDVYVARLAGHEPIEYSFCMYQHSDAVELAEALTNHVLERLTT